MNYTNRFKVVPGTRIKLNDIDPGFKGQHAKHKEAGKQRESWWKFCTLRRKLEHCL
jgi:hypothetical protein